MASPTFYPPAAAYYTQNLGAQRPLFQGDLFAGVFGAFWAHPEAVAARRAGSELPTGRLPFPTTTALLADVRLAGTFGLLLPHPCDFSEGEKGAAHPQRLVAPVFPASHSRVAVKQLRAGAVAHLVWLPRWTADRGEDDWYADLRSTASVDAAFLPRANRRAAMSGAAWVAFNDKLTRYFTGIALDRSQFILERSDLHPDSPQPPSP